MKQSKSIQSADTSGYVQQIDKAGVANKKLAGDLAKYAAAAERASASTAALNTAIAQTQKAERTGAYAQQAAELKKLEEAQRKLKWTAKDYLARHGLWRCGDREKQ